jgi:hypothetical protein
MLERAEEYGVEKDLIPNRSSILSVKQFSPKDKYTLSE